ncbi:hypothetical protein [Pseudofulvibacter geojedonensis]|uniref:hypothetical protein n=1 Tax=Pseudofulvibacter geojedonensis TaxID=1123758 RepID=UPI00366F0A73
MFNPIFLLDPYWDITKGSIYYLIRYLYILVFVAFFLNLKDKKIADNLLNIFKYVLVVNSIFILFGVLTEFKILTSYPRSLERFGSDGLFNKVNEVSHLYNILIANLYYNYIKSKKDLWLLLYIVVISTFLGTKTVLLFLSLLLIFHLTVIAKRKKIFRIILCFIGVVFILFFDKIMSFVFNLSPFWKELTVKYDIFTLLFSKRDLLFIKVLEYFDTYWNKVNFLIGGSFYSRNFIFTQMDIVDVFIFFGGIGTIVYILFIIRYFSSNVNRFAIIIFSFVFFCGLLSGALFLSVLSMIYLYLSLQNKKIIC